MDLGGEPMRIAFIGGPIAVVLFIVWLWVERWHLILPGTWPALKWLGLNGTLTGGLHGIWYGRHITSYINFLSTMARKCGPNGRYARWLENTYHGKIMPTELAKCIVGIGEAIPLQDLGTAVIPYKRARDIVINAPPDIVITQCGCKELHRRKGDPCKMCDPPYQTCMLIGKPLTDFLLDHKPDTSRRITRGEALELLDRFHLAGYVHAAWFKDCIKDQFYVICNCCSCCCLGFDSHRIGIQQFISSGFIAAVNPDVCEGCETALDACPFGAIEMVDGKSHVKRNLCMGCGVCISWCPHEARSLIRDEGKGRPLDVRNLTASAAAHRAVH
jgi:Pyruvate/2-oxoacid:ferredoxin oxidoreductase delta subunit